MTQDEMIAAPIPGVTDPAALIARAAEALAKRGALCVPDHRGTISKWYRGCLLNGPDAGWVAVVGQQNPESARLIEAAVAFRYEKGATGVVAILEKHPSASSKAALPKDDYVTRYQTVAWQGLNVLFTFRDGPDSPCHVWKQASLSPADDFLAIARDVELVLNLDKETWIPIEGSPEAEGLVRPSVHRVLKWHGFKRERGVPAPKGTPVVQNVEDGEGAGGKGYQGFWRRGASDGLWSRTTRTPHRIALEVKVSEDADAPLCQIIDHLGAAGAVLAVRVGIKPDYRGAEAPMMQLQGRLPVRYIQIDWDNRDLVSRVRRMTELASVERPARRYRAAILPHLCRQFRGRQRREENPSRTACVLGQDRPGERRPPRPRVAGAYQRRGGCRRWEWPPAGTRAYWLSPRCFRCELLAARQRWDEVGPALDDCAKAISIAFPPVGVHARLELARTAWLRALGSPAALEAQRVADRLLAIDRAMKAGIDRAVTREALAEIASIDAEPGVEAARARFVHADLLALADETEAAIDKIDEALVLATDEGDVGVQCNAALRRFRSAPARSGSTRPTASTPRRRPAWMPWRRRSLSRSWNGRGVSR